MTPITSAAPVLDVRPPSRNSRRAIVPAYLRGRADAEWPADSYACPKHYPARDSAGSRLSADPGRSCLAERCVGCMAGVLRVRTVPSIARVVPEADLAAAAVSFAVG